ncbi:MAG: FAD-binding oxidoreductase [Candidatus Bathyarchaeia archaeon]
MGDKSLVWDEVESTAKAVLEEKPFTLSLEEKRKIVAELKKVISSERVRDESHICACYRGGGGGPSVPVRLMSIRSPDIVVFPKSTEDVRNALLIASKYKIPVVPVSGHTNPPVPLLGGIVLDMTSMNKIHKIELEHNYAVIETGVTIGQLQEAVGPNYLIPKGSYPPSLPVISPLIFWGAQHNFVNRMWDQIIGLEVVMPDGSVLYTGSMLYGDVEHWTDVQTSFIQLKNLFCPNHASIGVVTKAAVRIWPVLDKAALYVFGFNDFASAYKWSHAIAKSPMIDQVMVWPWTTIGNFSGAINYCGLDWYEARANCDQDNPPQDLFHCPYYVFIQTRGYFEEVDGALKAAQRLARQFYGKYFTEDEIFDKPIVGSWYLYSLMQYLAKSPKEVMELARNRLPPSLAQFFIKPPASPAGEAPVLTIIFTGGVDEIIKFYDGLKNKFRELGRKNWGFYTRMFHSGQTPWFRFFPMIDAATQEDLAESLRMYQSIVKWALENYKVNVLREPFMMNDPNNPEEVKDRVKPVRRLLRAIQKEFDPENILNPLAKKYTLA